VPYDFRCAERPSPELARALESLHERAACDFAAALSGLARSPITVHVTGITQVTFAEFVRGMENPTCLGVIGAEPLATNLALDISPAVVYPVIDRLLGGIHESQQPVRRPLTEIERRLAARIITLMLEAMRRAWQDVVAVDFSLARVETDPPLAGVVLPSELVVLVGFEVAVGEVRGPMTCCIPRSAIDCFGERIASVVTGDSVCAAPGHGRPTNGRSKIATVELVTELAHARIPTSELIGLRVGDIITTEKGIHSPLVVAVEGTPKLHARPGAYKGRKAISIEERIGPPNSGT